MRVIVGQGSCGIAAGAGKVHKAIADLMNGEDKFTLGVTGCIGMCQYEPIVEVFEPGKDKVTYVQVSPEKVAEIVASHIVNGNPVVEYTVGAVVKD